MKYLEVFAIYNGSNGDATKALYAKLEAIGPRGIIAMNVFRAAKASERAKKYRGGNGGGSYRAQAYQKKQWSMDNLCRILVAEADAIGVRFGWGFDSVTIGFEHVLYVDLPTGQISFHTERRGDGPDYPDKWDGVRRAGPDRICRYVSHVLIAASVKIVRAFPNGMMMSFDDAGNPIPEFQGWAGDVLPLVRGAGFTGEVEVSQQGEVP